MFRFLSHIFGSNYEECKGCEILKQQLSIANEEKTHLTDTLLNILQPKVYELPAQELENTTTKAVLFSRRKAALEERDRLAAQTMRNSTVVGKSDSLVGLRAVEKLESELGITENQIVKEN